MSDRLTITIDGIEGKLDVGAFVSAISNTIGILRALERGDTEGSRALVEWELLSINKINPVTLEVRGTVKNNGKRPDTYLSRFMGGLESIESSAKRMPQGFNVEALERTQHLVSLLNFKISSIQYASNGQVVRPTQHAAANASEILGKRGYSVETSLDGWLDAIYAHGEAPNFLVFDPITDKGVPCSFPTERLDEVIGLLKNRVRVYGLAKFNKHDDVTSLVVDEFERLPNQDEVPTLDELHAAKLNITGGEDSADYIRRMRDEEN